MLQDQDCRISVSTCQTVRGPISVSRTRPIGGLYFLASVGGGREMETRRSLFRRVLRALYIMHPALRKGPPFFTKNTPYFPFFHKKHRPISFPAYGPVPPLLENRHGTISRTICTTVGSASACCCCWVSVSPFTHWRHVTSRTASPTTIDYRIVS